MNYANMRLAGMAVSFAVLLGGCANMADIPPGLPIASIEAQFGAPTSVCELPDGSYRAIWSQQPFGQYAWATAVSPDGVAGDVQQILNDRTFEVLGQGQWDTDTVWCMFGPPANIHMVGRPGYEKRVWAYRYRQYEVWYSMMYVFFDPDTNIVIEHYPGPDPMFLYDDNPWLM
jgi:hypothetical protein